MNAAILVLSGGATRSDMASLAGVEPATCRLGGGCSILLSYRDLSFLK